MTNWSLLGTMWFQKTLNQQVQVHLYAICSLASRKNMQTNQFWRNFKAGSTAVFQAILSRKKKDNKEKQKQRKLTRSITNLLQWFTKVLSGVSMSAGGRWFRPRKNVQALRSKFQQNYAIHEEKRFEVKMSWQEPNVTQPVETEDIEKIWSSKITL